MNEHVTVKSGQVEYQLPVEVQAPAKLPANIIAYEKQANEALNETVKTMRQSDGLIGPFGIDAFTAFIPLLNLLYTVYIWWVLMGLAAATRASGGTRLYGTAICGFDAAVGVWLGPGDIIDIFFRSHHLFAKRIIEETSYKLGAIQVVRERALPDGTIPSEELTELNAIIFRNGRDEKSNNIRLGVYSAIALLITYGVFVA